MKLRTLPSALTDLSRGKISYARLGQGLGEYFLNSPFSDIDSLEHNAGSHQKVFGYHRLLARRFPFAVYYKTEGEVCVVWTIGFSGARGRIRTADPLVRSRAGYAEVVTQPTPCNARNSCKIVSEGRIASTRVGVVTIWLRCRRNYFTRNSRPEYQRQRLAKRGPIVVIEQAEAPAYQALFKRGENGLDCRGLE